MNELTMLNFWPFWAPLTIFAVLWVYLMVHRQFRLQERAPDEVAAFLRRIDWNGALEVFNLPRERYLRETQTEDQFRRTMRVRLHMAREYTARMAHNVCVVHEWANTEMKDAWEKPPEAWTEREHKLQAVAVMAGEFRAFAFMRRTRLTLWIVLRAERWPQPRIPSIAALRLCGVQGEFDLLEKYRHLKESCADAALTYGLPFHEELLAGF
ncbi:MAG TPA: hypothetical protein VNW97_23015 [Candidatus Saccharimonadales bacterium]|jgi:hypothetical protein|nr:hypothetical protein [Candidatus Saccharimonadales bacterium]